MHELLRCKHSVGLTQSGLEVDLFVTLLTDRHDPFLLHHVAALHLKLTVDGLGELHSQVTNAEIPLSRSALE